MKVKQTEGSKEEKWPNKSRPTNDATRRSAASHNNFICFQPRVGGQCYKKIPREKSLGEITRQNYPRTVQKSIKSSLI